MKSRPEIFVSLIVAVVALTGLLGYTVVQRSQSERTFVSEQDRKYEAAHKQASKDSKNQNKLNNNFKNSVQENLPIAEQEAGNSVKVYFSKSPEADNDPSVVTAVIRPVNSEPLPTTSVKELIAGPSEAEQASGLNGGIGLIGESNCGSDDFVLNITEDKTQIQFCRQHISKGLLQDAREQAQITRTLAQFGKSENVIILDQAGNCLFATTSQNLCKQ